MNEVTTTQEQEPIVYTAEEQRFISLLSQGFNYTTAYRKAFPTAQDLAYSTVRRKASELVTEKNILTEVATHQAKQAHLARLAEDQIEETLTEGKNNKTTNDVAMFMYEQANGKAITKVQMASKHVHVIYDLSGGQAPPIPQDVLDQLADN